MRLTNATVDPPNRDRNNMQSGTMRGGFRQNTGGAVPMRGGAPGGGTSTMRGGMPNAPMGMGMQNMNMGMPMPMMQMMSNIASQFGGQGAGNMGFGRGGGMMPQGPRNGMMGNNMGNGLNGRGAGMMGGGG